jgi:hypothetical protein
LWYGVAHREDDDDDDDDDDEEEREGRESCVVF